MALLDPDALGFDPARLARIDALLADRYIAPGRLRGAQLLISRDGQVAHRASLGTMREDGRPMADDTLFRIASMTKPVTSVAFMMLVEEGLVALDDPVHRLVPELKDVGVYNGGGGDAPFLTRATDAPMRMIDLLRHTSGLTYGFQNRSNIDAAYRAAGIEEWRGGHDLDSFAAVLGRLPLEFSPGAAWNYSVSTDILGLVVERVSGLKLDAFFQSRVFDPLGMADSFFQVPDDKAHRLADCYAMHPKKGMVLFDSGEKSLWRTPAKLLSGGGGLVSSTADYHRFCRMLLNGGVLDGARLLSPKTVQLMTINHLPGGGDLSSLSKSLFSEAANAGAGFGLGFAVNIDVARTMLPGSVGEYYWGGMFSTAFFIDPVERIIMLFMTQLAPSSTWPVRRELKTMIYAALTRQAGERR
ncbi:serine hydrolase [uncultured Sphingomonas sp.]|uniref:serine hydrolase domain-containing protein n=1 Tax=uncultured Sphingomonas sp. TaxID=158754 RepID=UPI002636435C|nr:serine hydrolase domain-containing protein [uncultured Sphingomonas sp.]